MNTNRYLLVLGVVSLFLVGMVAASRQLKPAAALDLTAVDFHQRHPDWSWSIQAAAIPVTGDAAFPDYFQRHPEIGRSAILGQGASDYFMRHPELTLSAGASVDLTDFYFRQRESVVPDLSDYFFRHLAPDSP